jgi:hypothetical protein
VQLHTPSAKDRAAITVASSSAALASGAGVPAAVSRVDYDIRVPKVKVTESSPEEIVASAGTKRVISAGHGAAVVDDFPRRSRSSEPWWQKQVGGTESGSNGFYWMILLITLALHLFIIWMNNFGLPPLGGWTFGLIMIFFVVCLLFYFFAPGGREETRTAMGLSGFQILLYSLPALYASILGGVFPVNEQIISTIAIFIMLFPVFPFYAISRIGGWPHKIYMILLFLAVIYFVILPLFTYGAKRVPGRIGDNLAITPGDMWENSKDIFTSGAKSFTELFNRATDPGAYYTGQVEQNKRLPLGVYINNLRPQDKTINNDTDIIVFGNIKAATFAKEDIPVDPGCVMERKNPVAAIVNPPRLDLIYGTSQTFECTFPVNSLQWQRGTYTIKASATFPFETWAYIPYTFVDEERARNIARQGKDVKQVLGIQEQPVAIYTSGPIKVGMGGSDMPVLVRPQGDPIIPAGTRIGITIDPGWDKGHLNYVDRIELKVPKPFALGKCDRERDEEPTIDPNDELYNVYTFKNNDTGLVTTYTSITCPLQIPKENANEALLLVSEGDKVERSFVAVVRYKYTVEERTTVTVR